MKFHLSALLLPLFCLVACSAEPEKQNEQGGKNTIKLESSEGKLAFTGKIEGKENQSLAFEWVFHGVYEGLSDDDSVRVFYNGQRIGTINSQRTEYVGFCKDENENMVVMLSCWSGSATYPADVLYYTVKADTLFDQLIARPDAEGGENTLTLGADSLCYIQSRQSGTYEPCECFTNHYNRINRPLSDLKKAFGKKQVADLYMNFDEELAALDSGQSMPIKTLKIENENHYITGLLEEIKAAADTLNEMNIHWISNEDFDYVAVATDWYLYNADAFVFARDKRIKPNTWHMLFNHMSLPFYSEKEFHALDGAFEGAKHIVRTTVYEEVDYKYLNHKRAAVYLDLEKMDMEKIYSSYTWE